MIDEELLESLPGDPEEAFYIFESALRAKLIKKPEAFDNEHDYRDFEVQREENAREYFAKVAAFLSLYNFEVGVDFDQLFSSEGDYFWTLHKEATQKIQYFAMQCALTRNQKKKSGTTCIYVLDSAAKAKLHRYINKIREIIADANLSDSKREAFAARLNAFAEEVDRDRTKIEAFAAFYAGAKNELQDLSDLSDKLEKVWEIVGKGKELWKALPKPKINGYLDKPLGKIEDHSKPKETIDLDDEIPF